jgi:hypothetical protein
MATTPSENDVSSAAESQVMASESSRRYPLRSTRTKTKDTTASKSGANYDVQDDQIAQKRSYRKKQDNKTSRKVGRSTTPGKTPRLMERLQYPLSSTRQSHLQVATPAISQNHLNPIFLRMAHWISTNPTEVSIYIPNILN